MNARVQAFWSIQRRMQKEYGIFMARRIPAARRLSGDSVAIRDKGELYDGVQQKSSGCELKHCNTHSKNVQRKANAKFYAIIAAMIMIFATVLAIYVFRTRSFGLQRIDAGTVITVIFIIIAAIIFELSFKPDFYFGRKRSKLRSAGNAGYVNNAGMPATCQGGSAGCTGRDSSFGQGLMGQINEHESIKTKCSTEQNRQDHAQ